MLKSLLLENFKAFGETTVIPCAPITLIFGENSAGKSSILQALNLLKQTWASRDADTFLLLRSLQGMVDLGSFKELLFDHDLDRELRIRLEFELDTPELGIFDSIEDDVGALEILFSQPSLDDEVRIKELSIFLAKLHEEPLARFEPFLGSENQISNGFMFRREDSISLRRPSIRAQCTQVTQNMDWWRPFFETLKSDVKSASERLEQAYSRLQGFRSHLERRIDEEGEGQRQDSSSETGKYVSPAHTRDNWEVRELSRVEQELGRLENDSMFLQTDFDIESFINKMSKRELGEVIELDGFLPKGFDAGFGFGGWETRPVNMGKVACEVAHGFEDVLERLFPLSPFRSLPERWYVFAGTSPQDVGYQGQLFPDFLFRNKNVVDQANVWLERLDIGYKLDINPVGDTSDLFQVRLRDMKRNNEIDISLKDVGIGISQVLPFVVQSLAANKQIISIEQPEIHLHPRLQADIGDLLAESIKEPLSNQFIVETHSEHLVLRLQRLVRTRKLNANDVSIIYVSRHEEGARARRLRLDVEGDFIDNWPGGFFPERLRELF